MDHEHAHPPLGHALEIGWIEPREVHCLSAVFQGERHLVFPKLGLKEYVGDPVISFQVAAITTAILGGIGLLAGYFPARTAANLRPVEALKM